VISKNLSHPTFTTCSPPLTVYTRRFSLLLRTLFSGWLHCRNPRSTVKLIKMIDFEVSDACGCGLCYRPKAASRGLCGWFSVYTQYSAFTPTLKRELTRQTSVITVAHAHGALLTDVARTLQTAVLAHIAHVCLVTAHLQAIRSTSPSSLASHTPQSEGKRV
jgi:hypothetical protein